MNNKESNSQIERIGFKALGTDIDIQLVFSGLVEKERVKKDLLEIKEYYFAIEKKFSRFNHSSELSYFNNNLEKKLEASVEMIEVASLAILKNQQANGFFDPRIIGTLEGIGYDRDFKDVSSGKNHYSNSEQSDIKKKLSEDILIENGKLCFLSRMDFSGIVKGWITDKASQILIAKGWKNFLVDSGGDMFFAGRKADGEKWLVDIEGIPYEKLMFELSEEAVATSGIGKRKWERAGKRFHHIVNPKKTSEFSFDLQSVTVVADSAENADVWAKTIFLNGKEQGKKLAMEKGIACVILEYSGRVWISPAVKKYLYSPS